MKYSLLKIVQSVLSSMDSDEVESIHDSTESEQITLVCEDVFYELLEREEWPHLNRIINIDPLSDLNNPTALKLRDQVRSIHSLKYDVKDNDETNKEYRVLKYLRPRDFIDRSHSLKTSEDNVIVVEPNELAEVFIVNDRMPSFWTSFDDEIILLDSYDKDVDSWVQSSKTVAFGEVIPTFQFDDEYVPDLPIHIHPLYLAEVKAVCHVYFKQQQSIKDEQKVLRNISRLRRNKNRTGIDFYDERARQQFGRRAPRQGGYGTLGRR